MDITLSITLGNKIKKEKIFEKNQNGVAVWFDVPCAKMVLQISRPTVVRFSNRFLHSNRGIETVVLSTIKATNGVFKNQKILPASLKNDLKNPKLQEK